MEKLHNRAVTGTKGSSILCKECSVALLLNERAFRLPTEDNQSCGGATKRGSPEQRYANMSTLKVIYDIDPAEVIGGSIYPKKSKIAVMSSGVNATRCSMDLVTAFLSPATAGSYEG